MRTDCEPTVHAAVSELGLGFRHGEPAGLTRESILVDYDGQPSIIG